MEVYRICLAKYAGELAASGNPGRWNLRGQLIIYAAGSLPIEELTLVQMPADWQLARHYARCQPLGTAWYQRQTAAIPGCRPPSSPTSTTTCSIPAT